MTVIKGDPLLTNVQLAAACGADPAMILVVALASLRPRTLAEAFAMLIERRDAILQAANDAGQLDRLAVLEPELEYEPELSRLRPEIHDHEIRGKLLFRDILGKQSFFQVAAFEIAGIELSPSDAELLEHGGVVTCFADPRIWPLAVTRRTAAHGHGLARSLVAGAASVFTARMSALPVGGFMRYLDFVEASLRPGQTVDAVVDQTIAERRRIQGIGRPVVGTDERVPHQLELFQRYGRGDGASMRLAKEIDRLFRERKGLRVNSAGFHGALMRDLGFSPRSAAGFCMLYFLVPLIAHASYAGDRARSDTDTL